jgi:hypothetical protein
MKIIKIVTANITNSDVLNFFIFFNEFMNKIELLKIPNELFEDKLIIFFN